MRSREGANICTSKKDKKKGTRKTQVGLVPFLFGLVWDSSLSLSPSPINRTASIDQVELISFASLVSS